MAPRLDTDIRGKARQSRFFRLVQLHSRNKAALPHFNDPREVSQSSERHLQMLNFRLQRFQDPLVFKNLQARLGRGTAQRISGVAVAVGQSFPLGNRPVKSNKYFSCYQSNSERKIAATQAFT